MADPSLRFWHAALVLLALLACRQVGGGDDDKQDDGDEARREPKAFEAFTLERPVEPQGVDACGFTGGSGMACLDALLAEKDPDARRFMRRLSDAHAKLNGGEEGVPHAELAAFCQASGPCGGTNADGSQLDDGYACLTAAELHRDEPTKMQAYHARACRCGAERAQIPIMGGTLACDGPNRPAVRGANLSRAEARDADACGRCDHERGPAACRAEIDRLKSSDPKLAGYIERMQVPHCQGKTPRAPTTETHGCDGMLLSSCDCPQGKLGTMTCTDDRWSECDCSPSGLIPDANDQAADGLPTEIPPPGSPPPTPSEWQAVTKQVTVRGSSALKCETHMLREWLRVNCFENGFGAPTSLTARAVPGVQAYQTVRLGKKTSLVVQVVKNQTFRARFGWSDPAHPVIRTLVVTWPSGTARPRLYFE